MKRRDSEVGKVPPLEWPEEKEREEKERNINPSISSIYHLPSDNR